MNGMSDVIESRKAVFAGNFNQFHETFGVPLRQFWHPIMGFDIIAFDEKFICPADGVSTKQAVEAKYGQAAVSLVMGLLGI